MNLQIFEKLETFTRSVLNDTDHIQLDIVLKYLRMICKSEFYLNNDIIVLKIIVLVNQLIHFYPEDFQDDDIFIEIIENWKLIQNIFDSNDVSYKEKKNLISLMVDEWKLEMMNIKNIARYFVFILVTFNLQNVCQVYRIWMIR